MSDFAVRVAGLDDGNMGHWVLAVDGDRLLIAHEDKTLHWYPIDQCTFLQMVMPDKPKPVVLVQPPNSAKLVSPY